MVTANNEPPDEELLEVYDGAFDQSLMTDPASKPGTPHVAGVRAVYKKGVSDGVEKRDK